MIYLLYHITCFLQLDGHPASWWWSNSKAVSPRWRSPPFCQGFKITSLAISDLQKSEELIHTITHPAKFKVDRSTC
ncbi:unnamed protein product [Musa acuminata subsp. malaccensis]|uniref:(wild Malaysian banana) hypothetical protein n=1 Tax=Musa acuminata subsp. malaccensis TaxID=214687 RepID=A0A804JAT1_MUSAM|nr:unnamed protein product [Musa acuminata subsp. malaccensis]